MTTFEIPELVGERLTLRAFCEADLEPSFEMWADPATVRHVHDKPLTRSETWLKIIRFGGLWAIKGYGYWAIEENTSRRFVGQAGFADLKRDLQPPMPDSPEAGWAIHPEFGGKGMATEAMHLALGWLDEHTEHSRCHCVIRNANQASVRVAEKLGFQEAGEGQLGSIPVMAFLRKRVT